MTNNIDFSTFLYLSKNKNIISVYEENNFEKVYEEQMLIDKPLNHVNYQELDNFLNENIFKIEKKNR